MRIIILVGLSVCSALALTDLAGNVGPLESSSPSPQPGLLFPALNWTTVAPMLAPRRSMAAACAAGTFYCVGGYTSARVNTNEAYDPAGDSWSTCATMPSVRNACAGAEVNGKVYVVGGFDGSSRLTTVEEYDPAGDSWHVCPPMSWPRTVPAAVGLDGKLYCIGGFDGTNYPNTVERYDPAAGTWDTVAPMPTGRSGLATAVLDGKIYAIGGWIGTEPTLTTVEVYDPETDSWSTAASINTGRMYHSACALGGYLLTVGGQLTFNGPQTDAVEAFDTTSGQWAATTPMLVARGSLGVASAGREAYAAGGWTGTSALDQNDVAELASALAGPAGTPPVTPLTVTPSPARTGTSVRFSGPSGPVRIFNCSGRQMTSLSVPGTLDLRGFTPGVYVARCPAGSRRFAVAR